jgi:hydroxymethylpyrimidine/phosphomethylpyrimidine kinase
MTNGGFGMSAITALTAQNSRGVQGVNLTPDDFLSRQLDSILSDLPPAAIKTGMLPNAASVQVVAAKLRQYYCPGSSGSNGSSGGSNGGSSGSRRLPPLVIDPVLISTSGHALAGGGVGAALRDHLAPLAMMLTPNITEAEALWGEWGVRGLWGEWGVRGLLGGGGGRRIMGHSITCRTDWFL